MNRGGAGTTKQSVSGRSIVVMIAGSSTQFPITKEHRIMKTLYGLCVAASFAILLSASAARAEHACKQAFDKFCAGKVVCGKGACHACLNAHLKELGPKCSDAMTKWDEKEEEKLSKEVQPK
jgi:hypothetical protein